MCLSAEDLQGSVVKLSDCRLFTMMAYSYVAGEDVKLELIAGTSSFKPITMLLRTVKKGSATRQAMNVYSYNIFKYKAN